MLQTNATPAILPGMNIKAWAQVSAAGALIKGLNVTSITKGATGVYTATFTAALATATYIVDCQSRGPSRTVGGTKSTGAFTSYSTLNEAGALLDQDHFIAFYE